MSAAKGSVKKSAEIAERVKRLRAELGGLTQEQLADRLGITRAAVSQWEAESREPTPEAYLKLAMAAENTQARRWFLQQSQFDMEQLLLAAAEGGKVPPNEFVARLLSRLPRLPESVQVFRVDEKMGGAFGSGDIFILEPAADVQDPRPFWEQIVLVEFAPPAQRYSGWAAEHWPTGLFSGRLRCKRYGYDHLQWYAELGLFVEANSSPNTYLHRDVSGLPLVIGGWKHPGPPEEPTKGSQREKFDEEAASLSAEYEAGRDKANASDPIRNYTTREMTNLQKRIDEARSRSRLAKNAEQQKAEEEAKPQAPSMVKLYDGASIRGGVIAWFAAPKREG